MVNLVEMKCFQRCLIRMQKLKRHHSVSEGSVKESYHTINNVNLCAERYAPLFDFPRPKSQSFCVAPPEPVISFTAFARVSVPCVFVPCVCPSSRTLQLPQTRDGNIQLNHYVFNLAWVKAPSPAPQK